MSYCRWSSDDFRCDIYCYEDVSGGFTTHVAGNRVRGEIPRERFDLLMKPDRTEGELQEFMASHKAQMDYLETAERESIGLPYDGQSFNDPDLKSFLKRLLHLRATGYNFPDHVLENVREELAEESMQ